MMDGMPSFLLLLLALLGPTPASERPEQPANAVPSTPIPVESRQLLLVLSRDWNVTRATLRLYARASAAERWSAHGGPIDASIGRNGLGWGRGLHHETAAGPIKREGDGRAPAGVFDLRLAIGYAKEPLPGSRLPYQQATDGLRCVDDPRSRHYNALVDQAAVAIDWSSAEEMHRPDELYRHLIWVGHNDRPMAPGGGSCIFLHLRAAPTSVTAGCTAFAPEPMERLLRWLDPAARPVIAQLPWDEYERLRSRWSLPAVAAAP